MSSQLCSVLGGASGSSSSGRRRRSNAVSAVAVATCAAVCTAAGHCVLPRGLAAPAHSAELAPTAFVSGGATALRQRSAGGCARGSRVGQRKCGGTWAVPPSSAGSWAVPPSSAAPVPWFASDFVQQGKFRGAARLVRTASERLGAASAHLESEVAPIGSVFSSCATALKGAAAALLEERWVDAEGMIGASLDHLKLSAGAPSDPRQALSALGADLEVRAQELWSEASADALEEHLLELREASADALEEAAGALRAAARMFKVSREQAAADRRPQGPLVIEDRIIQEFMKDPQIVSARAAAHLVAATTREDRMKMLRTLATHHHPDRHPGSEGEVLPTFLLVQRLREEWKQQSGAN